MCLSRFPVPDYQCVEFADRFIAQQWGIPQEDLAGMSANGKDYTERALNAAVGSSAKTFATSYDSQIGNTMPTEDSLVAFGPRSDIPQGHVAVIGAVNFDEKTGKGTITLAQQNTLNFQKTLELSRNKEGAYHVQDFSGMKAIGWTAPVNTTPAQKTSSPSRNNSSAISSLLQRISSLISSISSMLKK